LPSSRCDDAKPIRRRDIRDRLSYVIRVSNSSAAASAMLRAVPKWMAARLAGWAQNERPAWTRISGLDPGQQRD
jgi:hypothetical protein